MDRERPGHQVADEVIGADGQEHDRGTGQEGAQADVDDVLDPREDPRDPLTRRLPGRHGRHYTVTGNCLASVRLSGQIPTSPPGGGLTWPAVKCATTRTT